MSLDFPTFLDLCLTSNLQQMVFPGFPGDTLTNSNMIKLSTKFSWERTNSTDDDQRTGRPRLPAGRWRSERRLTTSSTTVTLEGNRTMNGCWLQYVGCESADNCFSGMEYHWLYGGRRVRILKGARILTGGVPETFGAPAIHRRP